MAQAVLLHQAGGLGAFAAARGAYTTEVRRHRRRCEVSNGPGAMRRERDGAEVPPATQIPPHTRENGRPGRRNPPAHGEQGTGIRDKRQHRNHAPNGQQRGSTASARPPYEKQRKKKVRMVSWVLHASHVLHYRRPKNLDMRAHPAAGRKQSGRLIRPCSQATRTYEDDALLAIMRRRVFRTKRGLQQPTGGKTGPSLPPTPQWRMTTTPGNITTKHRTHNWRHCLSTPSLPSSSWMRPKRASLPLFLTAQS